MVDDKIKVIIREMNLESNGYNIQGRITAYVNSDNPNQYLAAKMEEMEIDELPCSEVKILNLYRGPKYMKDFIRFEITIPDKIIRKYAWQYMHNYKSKSKVLVQTTMKKNTYRIISASVGRTFEISRLSV